jgi:antirestriction protein ArdC
MHGGIGGLLLKKGLVLDLWRLSFSRAVVVVACIMQLTQATKEKGHDMTNAQIIANEMLLNGITEEAHTFAHWKALGYCVRKGEHATFKARIWKYAKGKRAQEVEDMTGEVQPGRMFLKTAHFFTRSQVEPLAA